MLFYRTFPLSPLFSTCFFSFSLSPPLSLPLLSFPLSLFLSSRIVSNSARTFLCCWRTVVNRKQLRSRSCGHLAPPNMEGSLRDITSRGHLTIAVPCMAFHASFDHRLRGYCGDSARSTVYRERILYSRCPPHFRHTQRRKYSSRARGRNASATRFGYSSWVICISCKNDGERDVKRQACIKGGKKN